LKNEKPRIKDMAQMRNIADQLQESGAILFKYRSMATETERNYTLDILDNHRLYCPAPASFNDPFECKAEISFKAPINVKNKRAKERLMKEKPHITEAEVEALAPDRWQQVEKKDPEEFPRWLQYDTGVVSFSEINDDILMWSHYAGRHNGVCIEFSCANRDHVDFFARIFRVHYQEKLPSVNFYTTPKEEQLQAFILTKAKHWEYEKEWRIVIADNTIQNSRYITLPSGIISAIYLGCKISQENRNEILRRVGSSSHNNIRVFRAKQRFNAYALGFELISG
jgi:hypothetical protein